VTGRFTSYFDPTGLAAARRDVRALRVVMMPALAIDTVCCSLRGAIGEGYLYDGNDVLGLTITSCNTLRVASDILSNSSIQHTPPSLKTSAPLAAIISSEQDWDKQSCPPLEYKLLRIGITGNIGRQTNSRRSLS
jgi:hypothetical protein